MKAVRKVRLSINGGTNADGGARLSAETETERCSSQMFRKPILQAK